MLIKKSDSKKYPLWLDILLASLLPVLLLVLWEAGTRGGLFNKYLLPAPSSLWKIFIGDLLIGKIWRNLSVSFVRVILGFLIGCSCGVIVGFFMGLLVPVNKVLSPITSLFRSIPVIALVPLFILLFGIGEASKRMIVAYASFWPVLLNTMGGIQSVDYKLCEVAYTYRIPKHITILKIILPSALPTVLTGIRLGISSSWMSIIAAEMFAASRGIGYLITVSKDNALIGPMFVYVFIIGAIGLLIDKILIRIQNFYLKKTRGMKG